MKPKSLFPLLMELKASRPLCLFPWKAHEDGRRMEVGEVVLMLGYYKLASFETSFYLSVLDQHGVYGYIAWWGWEREVLRKLFDSDIVCPMAVTVTTIEVP